MLFNSFIFAVFFPIILALYWVLPFRYQNYLLLAASYIFYGYWDWRFLSLIVISTIVDYITGLKIENQHNKGADGSQKLKKRWLMASIFTNLGLLGCFKYFNFFTDSLASSLGAFGINPDVFYLDIVLPVGISFYTFQTMSYTIDIYRGKMHPTKRFFDFALYVSFFPQLVAGPIERAKELLPRILKKRVFNRVQFFEGVHLIFWGLFKKVYVADNLSPLVDKIFSAQAPSGFEVVIGAYAFALQIYCDFSGYSDIARGCAKCMGIELMLNFNYPYVSINPSEFWQRWHISLSSWLRDYLYIPLGGNRGSELATYRNLSLTMLLGGLWHGASWVFVLWGAYQGALLIGHRLITPAIESLAKVRSLFPARIRRLLNIAIMFQLVCVGWIIFRAQSMGQIGDMAVAVFTWRGTPDWSLFIPLIQFGAPLYLIELAQFYWSKDNPHLFQRIPLYVRGFAYGVMFYLFAMHGAAAQSFVYFQF